MWSVELHYLLTKSPNGWKCPYCGSHFVEKERILMTSQGGKAPPHGTDGKLMEGNMWEDTRG